MVYSNLGGGLQAEARESYIFTHKTQGENRIEPTFAQIAPWIAIANRTLRTQGIDVKVYAEERVNGEAILNVGIKTADRNDRRVAFVDFAINLDGTVILKGQYGYATELDLIADPCDRNIFSITVMPHQSADGSNYTALYNEQDFAETYFSQAHKSLKPVA